MVQPHRMYALPPHCYAGRYVRNVEVMCEAIFSDTSSMRIRYVASSRAIAVAHGGSEEVALLVFHMVVTALALAPAIVGDPANLVLNIDLRPASCSSTIKPQLVHGS